MSLETLLLGGIVVSLLVSAYCFAWAMTELRRLRK